MFDRQFLEPRRPLHQTPWFLALALAPVGLTFGLGLLGAGKKLLGTASPEARRRQKTKEARRRLAAAQKILATAKPSHHPIEMQNYLFDLLEKAGEPHGMKLVGARAQNWLRQEKSYRAFGTELGRDATPIEAELPRFVDLSKEFHGKAAMQAIGIRSKCVTMLIDGPADADPWGKEVLFAPDGTRVGRLTSGGYSVAFGKSIGMGYVRPDLAVLGQKLKVRMFRELWDAVVVEDSPYDPANAAIRADG